MIIIIIQKDKYIDSYSRELTDAQQQYIVKEKELLSIVETLRGFRKILLGQKLRLYTDHNTIICRYFNTDRLLWWWLILEEYGLDIEYIKG